MQTLTSPSSSVFVNARRPSFDRSGGYDLQRDLSSPVGTGQQHVIQAMPNVSLVGLGSHGVVGHGMYVTPVGSIQVRRWPTLVAFAAASTRLNKLEDNIYYYKRNVHDSAVIETSYVDLRVTISIRHRRAPTRTSRKSNDSLECSNVAE